MNQIIEQIKQISDNYQQIRNKAEATVTRTPNWRIRCSNKGNRHYYYYKDPKDSKSPQGGRYADLAHMKTIADIVQNEYNRDLIREIDRQQQAIARFLDSFAPNRLGSVYEDLSPARRELITPLYVSDEEYVASWQAYQYERKPFADGALELYTERGERVRSKSEKIIADKFYSMGIPYRYECPIILKGLGTIHPDFTVLNKFTRHQFFWEHLGMMDNPEYADNALTRIDIYAKNGFYLGTDLILTYETSARPLNTRLLDHMIEHYLL